IANMTGVVLERPANLETTALGAAYLAGLSVGLWGNIDALSGLNGPKAVLQPTFKSSQRDTAMAGWHRAVKAAQTFSASSG
ncbi:MAG: glycerol kinase, partial [Pseudomonadota bacterium]